MDRVTTSGPGPAEPVSRSPADPVVAPGEAPPRLPGWRVWGGALIAGLTSLCAAMVSIRLTTDALRVPFGRDDAVGLYEYTRTMIRFGWFTWNPDIGYPYGMDNAHFPAPEIRGWLLLKAVSLVTQDPIVALNVFFLLGFFIVGACSYLLLLPTTRSVWLALVLATSAATLPWHFGRFPHALLADYSAVPIALLLAFLMWTGWWAHSVGRLLLAVGAAIYVGTAGVYYSFYALLALGPVLAWRVVRGRRPRLWWRDALITATIPLTLGLALVSHRALVRSPALDAAFVRDPIESFVFAGRFLTLFVPWPLADGNAEGQARYNVLGVTAMWAAIAIVVLLYRQTRSGGASERLSALAGELTPWLRLLVWMILWFAPGLGLLFAYTVSPNLRSWGRISIVILYVATVILGVALRAWWSSGRVREPVVAGVLLVVLAFQIGLDHRQLLAPWGAEFDSAARSYARGVDRTVEGDCPILQLPLVRYPEGFPTPTPQMGAYDHMWPQIYAPDHRWSFGVVSGTTAGQAVALRYSPDMAPTTIIRHAREDGYCAVHVDSYGMTPDQVRAYSSLLGAPAVEVDRWRLHLLDPLTRDSPRGP